jgi:hypothetical protein
MPAGRPHLFVLTLSEPSAPTSPRSPARGACPSATCDTSRPTRAGTMRAPPVAPPQRAAGRPLGPAGRLRGRVAGSTLALESEPAPELLRGARFLLVEAGEQPISPWWQGTFDFGQPARRWVPPMGAADGCRRWVPPMGAADGCRRWVPPMGAAGGCRRWVPPVGARATDASRGTACRVAAQDAEQERTRTATAERRMVPTWYPHGARAPDVAWQLTDGLGERRCAPHIGDPPTAELGREGATERPHRSY